MANSIPRDALRVKLNSFTTPSCVWVTEEVHEGMSEERKELYRLEQKLSESLRKRDTRPSDGSHLQEDQVVAWQSSHDERVWHRGRIECSYQMLTGSKYKVRLVDLGKLVSAKPKHLRKIPFNCESLPPQAILVVLEGIVPMSMGISFNFDSVKPAVCEGWTAASEKYIEDEVLKVYDEAYFLEGSRPRVGPQRFGDLLLIIGNVNKPLSLKKLLCDAGHALDSPDEFEKRIQDPSSSSAFEMCRSPSQHGSASDSMSSCPSSPAVSMMLSDKTQRNVPAKKPLSISEFKERQERRKLNTPEVTTISEESSQLNGETSQPRVDPPKSNGTGRLSILKRLMNSAPPASGATSNAPPASGAHPAASAPPATSAPPASDPTLASSSIIPIPLDVPPKDLGSNFVPAGRSIIHEQKPNKNSHYNRVTGKWASDNDRSDSDDHCRRSGPSFRPSSQSDTPACNSRSSTYDLDIGNTQGVDRVSSNPSDKENHVPPALAGRGPVLNRLALIKASINTREEPPVVKAASTSSSTAAGERTIHPKTPVVNHERQEPIKERLLRPGPSLVNEDIMEEEEYLARSILLHGGNAPTPWMSYRSVKGSFTQHIEQYLINKRWSHNLLTIEKFMWPAITQRQNVVMISPKKSGKTTSYTVPLMDFMIDLEEAPKGNGPLVLILCAGSKQASEIHYECIKLVNGVKNAPRVLCAYGLALDQQLFLKMVNGCEVFITTPPCFLRILKDYKHTYALNLNRLQHYVLDGADNLMTRFLDQITEIQSLVIAEQTKRAKNIEKGPIQIIVSSEKWVPQLLSFCTNLCGNPLLCINDCFEAVIYGKVDVVCRLTHPDNKPRDLLNILDEIAGRHKVIVFCSETEVVELQDYLAAGSLNLLTVTPGSTLLEIQGFRHSWDCSSDGQHYVLLCADSEFDDLKCKDATYIIHYSLPYNDRTCFVKRLSAISSNIPNIFVKKPQTTPSVQVLVDETNSDQFPVIVQLMHRISNRLDNRLLEASKIEEERKEKRTKGNKLFCKNLKMFGQCQRDGCPNRHVFIPELDESAHLPRSGVVCMYIKQVHSAGHFSARLTKQRSHEASEEDKAGQYLKLPLEMSLHFSKERTLLGDVNIGDVCAMESVEGLYNRVQVLEVLEKNKHGNPALVLVQFIDEGNVAPARVYMLYSLPDKFKDVPPQVVDVFLCGLLPADMDEDYCSNATNDIQNLVNSTQKQESHKFFQGKVVMSMSGSLWVDPLTIMEWLPHTQTYVVRENIRESLLNQHHALENPRHMSVLCKMCGKDDSATVSAPAGKLCELSKCKSKPDWAFLESDGFEDVEFMWAYPDGSVIFKRTKFGKLLETLQNDIGKEAIKRNAEEVASLSEGDLCLAKHPEDEKWYRAKIISKNKELFNVFYVDFGDEGIDVSVEQLNIIPDWAITRLPFQAIECSLAGVSSFGDVDTVVDIANAPNLLAKVCECREVAHKTGGRHYVVAVINFSNVHEPFILNKHLLELDGFQACEDQLKFLDFEIDGDLVNRFVRSSESPISEEFEDIGEEINLSDMELDDDEDDEDAFDGFDKEDIDWFIENVKKDHPELQKMVESEVKKNLAVVPQPAPVNTPVKEEINEKPLRATDENEKGSVVENEKEELSDWEEEKEYFGRFELPELCSARPPQTKWLEDLYFVWIKFCIADVDKFFLHCSCDRIQFSAFVNGRYYHLDKKLRGIVYPGSVVTSVKGFTVEVKLKKTCGGVMWERPFATNRRYHWLKKDMDTFTVESSDSENEMGLGTVNREIRKIPLKQRRRRHDRNVNRAFKPDMASDTDNSNCEHECIDSDEMF